MLKSRTAIVLLLFLEICGASAAFAAESPAGGSFPPALESYVTPDGASVLGILKDRIRVEPFNLVASILFLLAIIHTFLAPKFLHLAHQFDQRLKHLEVTRPASVADQHLRAHLRFKAYVLHLLGEVEAIFGIWVIPLLIAITLNKAMGFNILPSSDSGFSVTPRSVTGTVPPPRPDRWIGYRVWAEQVELWVGQPARIHDRAVWTRTLGLEGAEFVGGPWSATRLQP
jgi:hypothetical protein